MDAELFLQTAQLAEDLIASDAVGAAWDHDSALEGYTVGGLAGHLARAVLTVSRYLDAPAPAEGQQRVDGAGYFAAVLRGHDPVISDLHDAIRQRSEAEAAEGQAALVERLSEARTRLVASLEGETMNRQIQVLDGVVLTVGDYLQTRVTELVIHLDDLAVSVPDAPRPEIPEAAFVLVAGVLGRVAAWRQGGLETVRSLSRAERHPDPVRAF